MSSPQILAPAPAPATATASGPVERQVVMLVYPDFELLDAVGPLEAFATAAGFLQARGLPGYSVQVVAAEAGPVRASSGLELLARRGRAELADPALMSGIDTLLVAGGRGVERACEDPHWRDWLQAGAGRVRRLGSICTGALLLAAAGLLDGRRAVTHWNWCERLARRHPRVVVEPDALYLCDQGVWTSAGVTAGIDLALALIQADHGRALALRVARELVMYLHRPGGQSQFSEPLQAQAMAPRAAVQQVQERVRARPQADLRLETLAALVALSPRHLSRAFVRDTGLTPAAFVEQVRLQQARQLLEQTALPLSRVAQRCGFASADVMGRCFRRRLGLTPLDHRTRFGPPPLDP
ncbi:AraC family transcriptional regulator with amidase-like domain [Sphaerotilus hippei]|uniref:AraC family transcriptional regulator with amidase-like domain n=1 Tax=Sphaerotilus hippei TaxID=744406 RepID=A0A318GW18_9BURK|nr:helix-turn-helix domain-containing protein [Sphaerotilus hippei]PXW92418.1 AraC family transcriptional regulator with amidase-like domain [Sphaerotilus hippei]